MQSTSPPLQLKTFMASRPRTALLVAIGALALVIVVAVAILVARHNATPPLSNKQQAQALVSAGIRYQASGQTSQAVADYNSAIALDPSNKYAYYNRGVIEQGQGKAAPAEADYRMALSLDPKFEDALYNLAVLVTPTDPAQAAQLYKQVIAVDSRNAEAHLNLGFILLQQGDKAGARAQFNVAVTLKPSLKSRIPNF